jgi:hypothetical protein
MAHLSFLSDDGEIHVSTQQGHSSVMMPVSISLLYHMNQLNNAANHVQ